MHTVQFSVRLHSILCSITEYHLFGQTSFEIVRWSHGGVSLLSKTLLD